MSLTDASMKWWWIVPTALMRSKENAQTSSTGALYEPVVSSSSKISINQNSQRLSQTRGSTGSSPYITPKGFFFLIAKTQIPNFDWVMTHDVGKFKPCPFMLFSPYETVLRSLHLSQSIWLALYMVCFLHLGGGVFSERKICPGSGVNPGPVEHLMGPAGTWSHPWRPRLTSWHQL